MNEKEKILCAAVYYDDGKVYKSQPTNIKTGYVVTGYRHDRCIITHNQITMKTTTRKDIQGFLTSDERFVSRKEAWKIAVEAKQVEERQNGNNILFSEDLY